MEKIKELLLLEDKTLLHKELPRIRKLEQEYRDMVQDLLTNWNALNLSRVLDEFFEVESLHKKVIDILEPK